MKKIYYAIILWIILALLLGMAFKYMILLSILFTIAYWSFPFQIKKTIVNVYNTHGKSELKIQHGYVYRVYFSPWTTKGFDIPFTRRMKTIK